MKTSVIEVHDMLAVLGVEQVEKQIGEVMGVESVTVNYAAGNATVRYDETRLNIGDVKSTVRQHGFESDAPKGAADTSVPAAGAAQQDQAVPPAMPSTPTASAPESHPTAPDTESTDDKQQEKTAPDKS